MVKVQRLFAKTNLKILVWRIEKIGSCELRIRGVENENNNYIY